MIILIMLLLQTLATCQGCHLTIDDKQVVIPRENLPAVVVYQPDCPLKLEFAQLRGHVEGGSASGSIRFSNLTDKAISYYKVAYIMTGGAGAAWTAKGVVAPGERIPERTIPSPEGIAPLTPMLQQKLGLGSSLVGMWVIMVVRVEFTDGTIYSDEKLYIQLKEYLSSL